MNQLGREAFPTLGVGVEFEAGASEAPELSRQLAAYLGKLMIDTASGMNWLNVSIVLPVCASWPDLMMFCGAMDEAVRHMQTAGEKLASLGVSQLAEVASNETATID